MVREATQGRDVKVVIVDDDPEEVRVRIIA
jgi:hypothetical protein